MEEGRQPVRAVGESLPCSVEQPQAPARGGAPTLAGPWAGDQLAPTAGDYCLNPQVLQLVHFVNPRTLPQTVLLSWVLTCTCSYMSTAATSVPPKRGSLPLDYFTN